MPAVASGSSPNPFSTRFVRPDQSAYRFSDFDDPSVICTDLIAQLSLCGAAAIIGPHGTGKSTLLRTLAPALKEAFHQVDWLQLTAATDAAAQLQQGQRATRAERVHFSPATHCLVIDGFEQLSWVTRQRLIWQTLLRHWPRNGREQPRRWCLLVTAHRPQFAVKTVYRTRWDDCLVRTLTAEKLQWLPQRERMIMLRAAEQHASRIKHCHWTKRSVRDYWFALYDEYERLRRHPSDATGSLNRNTR